MTVHHAKRERSRHCGVNRISTTMQSVDCRIGSEWMDCGNPSVLRRLSEEWKEKETKDCKPRKNHSPDVKCGTVGKESRNTPKSDRFQEGRQLATTATNWICP